ATAGGRAVWPTGPFAGAYEASRKTAIEGLVEADPVAACVRRLMAECDRWTGTASDLLCAANDLANDDGSTRSAGWPKNAGALAGRLRRAQTFLRMLGIEIAFSRKGRAGPRTIRISSPPSAPSASSARFATTSHPAVHKETTRIGAAEPLTNADKLTQRPGQSIKNRPARAPFPEIEGA